VGGQGAFACEGFAKSNYSENRGQTEPGKPSTAFRHGLRSKGELQVSFWRCGILENDTVENQRS
jgi:hypothetical protein